MHTLGDFLNHAERVRIRLSRRYDRRMSDETTLLERDGVMITTRRAVIGGTAYSIAALTSVSVGRTIPGFAPIAVAAVGFTLAGLSCVSHALRDGAADWALFGVGVLLVVVGALGGAAIWRAKGLFVVQFDVGGKRVSALESQSDELPAAVVAAINDAMARGR